jgi:hypothetical protein
MFKIPVLSFRMGRVTLDGTCVAKELRTGQFGRSVSWGSLWANVTDHKVCEVIGIDFLSGLIFVRDPDGLTIELNFFNVTKMPEWDETANYDEMPRVTA